MGRPGSRRAGRLVRSFLDPGLGRFQLGREPRPFARRCDPVLGGWRGGASRAPGGVEICAAARTGKRGAEGAHNRQRCVRAGCAAAVHRKLDPSRLSRGSPLPHTRWRSGRRGGRHREHHFALPHVRCSRGHAVRRSRAHVERAVDRAPAQSATLACDAGSVRNARALVSASPLRHWRYSRDRASTGGALADRAGDQARDRHRSVVSCSDCLVADLARRRDRHPPGLVRSGPVPADPARFQWAAVPDLQVSHNDGHGKW